MHLHSCYWDFTRNSWGFSACLWSCHGYKCTTFELLYDKQFWCLKSWSPDILKHLEHNKIINGKIRHTPQWQSYLIMYLNEYPFNWKFLQASTLHSCSEYTDSTSCSLGEFGLVQVLHAVFGAHGLVVFFSW